jgi:hypothetical protein
MNGVTRSESTVVHAVLSTTLLEFQDKTNELAFAFTSEVGRERLRSKAYRLHRYALRLIGCANPPQKAPGARYCLRVEGMANFAPNSNGTDFHDKSS